MGNRVTLTYNLLAQSSSHSVDTLALPLYNVFRDLLIDRDFMPRGGKVAFGLELEYPTGAPPALFKGTDLELIKVVKGLHLEAEVLPVFKLDDEEWDEDDDEYLQSWGEGDANHANDSGERCSWASGIVPWASSGPTVWRNLL